MPVVEMPRSDSLRSVMGAQPGAPQPGAPQPGAPQTSGDRQLLRVREGLLLVFCMIFFCVPATAESDFTLRPGEPIVQDLAPGALHLYQAELAATGAWYVEVDQRDIDVTVTVRSPGGKILVAVDSPLDRQGREAALFETGTAGVYRVEVRSREATAATGRYEIRIDPLSDPRRLEAAAAETEGARLYREGTPEAWRRALSANARAFEVWRELGETHAAARALYANAVLYRLLDENRRALELGRQVLPLWQDLGDRIFTANAWNEIALNQWHLGETPTARSLFARALELHRDIGHPWGVAVASANLCLMDLVEGKLQAGAQCNEKAAPRLKEVRALDLAATAATNAGRAYDLLGEPEKALASYLEALELGHEIGDRVAEARTLNNLGVLYREMGELGEALTSFDLALQIFRESGQRHWQASVLNNIGVVYQYLRQPEQALVCFHQALALWREIERPRGEATALVNLGLTHRRRQRLREAREFLTEALTAWRAVGDRREEALTRADLGRVAMDLDDFTTAVDFLGQGAAILRAVDDPLHEAAALTDLGAAHNALGRLRPAGESLHRALQLVRELGYPPSEARTRGVLARTLSLEGTADAAWSQVEAAIDLVENSRYGIAPPTLRASFAGTFHGLYELAVDLLLAAGDPGGALEMSERARARTLLELLQEADVDVYAGGDPELLERRRSLLRRLDAKVERAVSSGHSPLAEEQAAILRQLDVVEAELRRDRSAPDRPQTASMAEIRALLDGETVLLVFALGETRSLLWSLDAGGVRVHELAPRRQIEDAARRFHEGVARFDPGARRQDARAGAELARLLFAPLAGLPAVRRLVIVPDGALFYVPFEALPVPARPLPTATTPVPLLERYEIVYLPSASVLAAQRRKPTKQRPAASRSLAVVADPVFAADDIRLDNPAAQTVSRFKRLPATRQEAEAIAALAAPGKVLTALGFDANRELVLGESLRSYRFIHFATHGIIDTQTPTLSALVLSLYDRRGQTREGFLRLHDIYGLRLDAELVVLSGCRTALGTEMRGEGLWGLTRGFFSTGARRVLASLWQVEDRAAAELMQRFYSALWQEGMTPAAALRSAKLSLRRERRWRDPHFWAAFVLEGDWR